jgi:hypothetical protein
VGDREVGGNCQRQATTQQASINAGFSGFPSFLLGSHPIPFSFQIHQKSIEAFEDSLFCAPARLTTIVDLLAAENT